MKKLFAAIVLMALVFSLTACGAEQASKLEDSGEGIGEVITLTEEERTYVEEQTTNSWLELTETEKDDLVVLIGRCLEADEEYIVEDYDELVDMLDHQMEQYSKNDVDESVLDTVYDILEIA